MPTSQPTHASEPAYSPTVTVVDEIVVVIVDVDPHCVNPSGHVCANSSSNELQMPVPANLQGPLLPPTHPWHCNAGGNEVVSVEVRVVVVGSQYVMPAGHVLVDASSNKAQIGVPA